LWFSGWGSIFRPQVKIAHDRLNSYCGYFYDFRNFGAAGEQHLREELFNL
jgi:hypothetical protein